MRQLGDALIELLREDLALFSTTADDVNRIEAATVLTDGTALVQYEVRSKAGETAESQKAQLVAWNTTLSSLILASQTTAYLRNVMGDRSISVKMTGGCQALRAVPENVVLATGQITLAGTANFSYFDLSKPSIAAEVKGALTTDIAVAIGVQSSMIAVTAMSVRAIQTAMQASYQVAAPIGMLSAAVVTQWKELVAQFVNESKPPNATTTLYAKYSSGNGTTADRIAIASFDLAAPPPPSTSTAVPPSPSPHASSPPPSDDAPLDSHCILATFNHCVWVEVGLAALVVAVVALVLWRWCRRRQAATPGAPVKAIPVPNMRAPALVYPTQLPPRLAQKNIPVPPPATPVVPMVEGQRPHELPRFVQSSHDADGLEVIL